MGQIKGKQIKNDSLDLEKIRSGSKILPDTATLGSDKSIEEIIDNREFTTKDYVDNRILVAISDTTTLAGNGLNGDSTSGIININTGNGIIIESDAISLDIKNYSDTDKISITTTDIDGISLIATNGDANITALNTITLYGNELVFTTDSGDDGDESIMLLDSSSIGMFGKHIDFDTTNGIDASSGEGIINITSAFNTNITSNNGSVNIDAPTVLISSSTTSLYLNGGGLYTDVSGTNGGLKYATDYSSTYSNRSLVDKAYVDSIVGSSALNQNVWLAQTGFSLSGTSGIVTYGGTFTYPINAITDADIFINGIKLKKQEYYFDTINNYKPTTTSTLYFDLTYLPYTIESEDYVEIKYLS